MKNSTLIISKFGAVRVCEHCGVSRYVPDLSSWGYFYGCRFACSYHCMMALRDADPDRRRIALELRGINRSVRISNAERDAMLDMRAAGATLMQIAAAFDRDYKNVLRLFKRLEGKKRAS